MLVDFSLCVELALRFWVNRTDTADLVSWACPLTYHFSETCRFVFLDGHNSSTCMSLFISVHCMWLYTHEVGRILLLIFCVNESHPQHAPVWCCNNNNKKARFIVFWCVVNTNHLSFSVCQNLHDPVCCRWYTRQLLWSGVVWKGSVATGSCADSGHLPLPWGLCGQGWLWSGGDDDNDARWIVGS